MTAAWRIVRRGAILAAFAAAGIAHLPEQVHAAVPASNQTSHTGATLRAGLWTLWHDKEISIAPAAGTGASLRMCESCPMAPLARATQVRAQADRLVVDGDRDAASIWIGGSVRLAAHGETVTLHNPIRISARAGELVLAVTLPVESYVERVVASESGAADSPESLKALAIVVRSFALHLAHGHADYDLCDSTHCQLLHWGGNAGRDGAAHAATLTTAGETLWFQGKRAEAWFHQNCGGRTASPSEIWPETNRKPMPWLASRADNYCIRNGAREWSASLSLAEMTAALARQGLVRPGWNSLTVERRGESGRAVTLLAGSTEISAEDFLLAVGRTLGWDRILSTWFEVSRQGDRFGFHGRGSGHGVGLCQAGAAAMGSQGRDANQILAQYFPGALAADENTGLTWQRIQGQGLRLETLDPADSAYLPQLSQALGEAENRSGLKGGELFIVRAFPSTSAYRDATLAPGWVAAFTEGNWAATQPLRTLAERKLLVPILRHEFLHVLVESQTGANAPLWLREGLVECWGGDAEPAGRVPALKLEEVDGALAHSATEAQSAAAHHAAGWYAGRLLTHFGREQVLGWLHSGVPASAIKALK
jgi:stage II sporulation protein D